MIGHARWHRKHVSPVIGFQHMLAEVGVKEVGRSTPHIGISFCFGGQMLDGQSLNAAQYLENIAKHIHMLSKESRETLELMAGATFLASEFILVA
jgi:hypothetical protein